MALINNLYVFVKDESVDRSTEVTQHPVEKGLPISDGTRNEPITLSVSGKIVDAGNLKASEILEKLEKLRTSGSVIRYQGRNYEDNYLITSFNSSHPNTNWAGADFNMSLLQVRIAQSSYKAPKAEKQAKAEKVQKKNAPVLKVGATVVFKGGPVYVSSDAKKAAAKRGRSTCKITIINTRSWSKHSYHLISKDGGKVYGWVDKGNIEGAGSGASGTATAPNTNGGTQQVKNGKSETKPTTNSISLTKIGVSKKDLVVGSESFFNKNTVKIGSNTYYCSSDGTYYLTNVAKKRKTDGGRTTVIVIPKGTAMHRKK